MLASQCSKVADPTMVYGHQDAMKNPYMSAWGMPAGNFLKLKFNVLNCYKFVQYIRIIPHVECKGNVHVIYKDQLRNRIERRKAKNEKYNS